MGKSGDPLFADLKSVLRTAVVELVLGSTLSADQRQVFFIAGTCRHLAQSPLLDQLRSTRLAHSHHLQVAFAHPLCGIWPGGPFWPSRNDERVHFNPSWGYPCLGPGLFTEQSQRQLEELPLPSCFDDFVVQLHASWPGQLLRDLS